MIYCQSIQSLMHYCDSTKPAFTCWNLTIETLEQGVKYVQSSQINHQNDTNGSLLMLYCWGKFSLWNAIFYSANLLVEEMSQNKPVVQTPVTWFINQKEKHVSIRHNLAHHFPALIQFTWFILMWSIFQ